MKYNGLIFNINGEICAAVKIHAGADEYQQTVALFHILPRLL